MATNAEQIVSTGAVVAGMLFERWPYQRVFHPAIHREKPTTPVAARAR